MAVYIIQDKFEDKKQYCASRTTLEDARQLVKELEDFDWEEGDYVEGRYTIELRGYCYNNYAEKCGNCTNGICMLKDPDVNCPLVGKRALLQAAGEYADQPALQPGA